MSKFYCPLYNLNLDADIKFTNDELEISTDLKLKIVNNEILNSLSNVSDELSKNEQKLIRDNIMYWLHIEGNFNTEIVYIFQLASWIVKPTKLRICFMINSANIAEDDLNESNFLKLKEIEYIPKHVEPCFHNEDVTKLKRMFPILLKLYKHSPIFYTAIGLNIQGCVAFHWDAAYVLYTTTFEALLTHKPHISYSLQNSLKWWKKKQLSWAYAILIENKDKNRQIAFDDFRKIYKIRSEILHGESFEDEYGNGDGDINLEELAKCRDMLRKLWQVILDSEEIIENLSGDDKDRRKYFMKVANGWMPEDKYEKKV